MWAACAVPEFTPRCLSGKISGAVRAARRSLSYLPSTQNSMRWAGKRASIWRFQRQSCFRHPPRTDLGCVSDSPAQTATRRAVVQTTAHARSLPSPHATSSPVPPIRVEFLRFLAVLQSPPLQLPSLGIYKSNWLEGRVVICSYNSHIGSFSPEPFDCLRHQSLLGSFARSARFLALAAHRVLGLHCDFRRRGASANSCPCIPTTICATAVGRTRCRICVACWSHISAHSSGIGFCPSDAVCLHSVCWCGVAKALSIPCRVGSGCYGLCDEQVFRWRLGGTLCRFFLQQSFSILAISGMAPAS
jgi:hypothetical protein